MSARRFAACIGLIALSLLIGCNDANPVAADGYRFEQAEWVNTDLRVRLVLHDTIDDVRAAARAAGIVEPEGEPVEAWSTISPSGSCTIHIVDPRKRYGPEYAGHELMHCAFGRFHGPLP